MNLYDYNKKNYFTPDNIRTYSSIYISRLSQEKKLLMNLNLHHNLIIEGDKGVGKSWIVRKVLKDNGNYHRFIDLREISSTKNLSSYINSKLLHYKWRFTPPNSDIHNISNCKFYHEEYIKFMINKSRLKYRHANEDINKNTYIVLEHFEDIINNISLLEDLNNFFYLLRESNHNNLYIIILSALEDTKNYIDENLINNFNKISTIPRFSHSECTALMDIGFKKMKLSFTKPKLKGKYYYNIMCKAMYNPNELQRLCMLIADKAIKNDLMISGNIINDVIAAPNYDTYKTNTINQSI